MFYLLAEKTLSTYPGWNRHNRALVDVDDAYQEAVLRCLTATPRFDAARAPAYNFYRETIKKRLTSLLSPKEIPESRQPDRPVVSIDDAMERGEEPTCDERLRWLYLQSEKPSKRKLSPSKAAEIRTRLSQGETGVQLAREFDVTPSTISKVKNGRLWRAA